MRVRALPNDRAPRGAPARGRHPPCQSAAAAAPSPRANGFHGVVDQRPASPRRVQERHVAAEATSRTEAVPAIHRYEGRLGGVAAQNQRVEKVEKAHPAEVKVKPVPACAPLASASRQVRGGRRVTSPPRRARRPVPDHAASRERGPLGAPANGRSPPSPFAASAELPSRAIGSRGAVDTRLAIPARAQGQHVAPSQPFGARPAREPRRRRSSIGEVAVRSQRAEEPDSARHTTA